MARSLQAALVHHQRGQLDLARPMYESFLREDPNNPDVLNLLGVLLLQQGEAQQSVRYLERAAVQRPLDGGLLNNLGNARRANGSLAMAVDAWNKAVAIDPTNADAWCNLGVASLEGGQKDVAASNWRKALALNPRHVDALNMLAVYLNELGQVAEAMTHWRTALGVVPSHQLIIDNLVAALHQQAHRHVQGDRPQRAEKLLREIVQQRPDDLSAWTMLARALQLQGKRKDAFAAYHRALSIDGTRPEIHHNIGNLLKDNGQDQEAIAAFRRALSLGSTHPATQHALAALTGEGAASAPHAVVRDLFDDYASRFESHLTEALGYDIPTHLRALFGDSPVSRMLDLGCGTGLSAEAFSGLTGDITGVDLSPNMLHLAEEKGLYAALVESDMLTFLQRPSAPFDLIVAADVFPYCGDLSEIFPAIAARLSPSGHVLFSTEHSTADGDFLLQKSERFSHTAAYIERMANAAGLLVVHHREQRVRKDQHGWIGGAIYMLRHA